MSRFVTKNHCDYIVVGVFFQCSVFCSFSSYLLINVTCNTHLKWSCRATFRSKESPLSSNPIPMKAVLPLSSIIRRTKYRLESVTDSTAIPGYCSTGHLANNSPTICQSSLIIVNLLPHNPLF